MKKGQFQRRKKGRFIVIDGIDGSGKATQSKLLENYLMSNGLKVKNIDFPRYYDNFFGQFIGECLSGEHGDFINADPRMTSVLYAADRFESSKQIKNWLNKGFWVIADRYVSANQIHQGGKIKNSAKRRSFLDWLEKMEHGVFELPYPDLVIYLDVTIDISKEWLEKKDAKKRKKYLKGKKDLAEKDIEYLKNSRNAALNLEKKNENWKKIMCYKKGKSLDPEEVNKLVVDVINKELN